MEEFRDRFTQILVKNQKGQKGIVRHGWWVKGDGGCDGGSGGRDGGGGCSSSSSSNSSSSSIIIVTLTTTIVKMSINVHVQC